MLFRSDFRAAERTFQVLSQVIGRAGRGELPGRVLLQTMHGDHYSISRAVAHDYEQFYQEELSFRGELHYPPFGHLAAVRFSATSEGSLLDASRKAADLLQSLKKRLGLRSEILGPAPALLYRLRGRFRHQILLKDTNRTALRRLLHAYRTERHQTATVREALDIDPVDLL